MGKEVIKLESYVMVGEVTKSKIVDDFALSVKYKQKRIN